MMDPPGVATLHLGQREGDELRYIGKVGTSPEARRDHDRKVAT